MIQRVQRKLCSTSLCCREHNELMVVPPWYDPGAAALRLSALLASLRAEIACEISKRRREVGSKRCAFRDSLDVAKAAFLAEYDVCRHG